jgi:hypothetical protein
MLQSTYKNFVLGGTLAAASLLLSGTALATENGNESYPLGVNTAQPALLPPPGATEYYNYTAYIVGQRFASNTGGMGVPEFHLAVFAEAPRFIHTWTPTWGNWHISSGLAININDTRLDAAGTQFHRFAIGDPNIVPLYLTYNTQKLHVMFGANIWLPLGDYNKANPASAGLNYWTGAPEFSVTWLPTSDLELSFDSFTQFKTRNNQTQYHSGNDTDIDYDIGWRPTSLGWDPRLQFGIVGYLYKQWTNDSSDGVTVYDFKGQVYAVGPQIRYDVIKHGGVLVKWQHEMDVRNRPEGNRLWVEFAAPL